MLKSDQVTVGAVNDFIVWRWKRPNPYKFLFSAKCSACLYLVGVNSEVTRHEVLPPYGSVDACSMFVNEDSLNTAALQLTNDGVITAGERAALPDGLTLIGLVDATTSAGQQAIYQPPAEALTVLEF